MNGNGKCVRNNSVKEVILAELLPAENDPEINMEEDGWKERAMSLIDYMTEAKRVGKDVRDTKVVGAMFLIVPIQEIERVRYVMFQGLMKIALHIIMIFSKQTVLSTLMLMSLLCTSLHHSADDPRSKNYTVQG